MTIRRRLTLWYAILLALIIVTFGAITFGVMRYAMIENIDNRLRETEQVIRNAIRTNAADNGQDDVQIILPALDSFYAADIYVQAWAVHDTDHILKSHSDNIAMFDNPLDPKPLGHPGTHMTNADFHGLDVRVMTRPIISNGVTVGWLQVAGDLSTVNDAIEQLLLVMLISCGFAILGSVILSLWFSHRALKPIEEITHAAASVAGTDDLGTRLKWSGPNDELGRLTSVFNQMMGRLEGLFLVQQRFVADVSHELRTPLTSIQGNLELIRRYGVDDESLDAMESEAGRMARLVNDLLMLARTDTGGVKVELFPTDLDTIMLDTYEQARVLTKDRDLKVVMGQFEPVRIQGNPDRLRQLMLNLIGNAVKFTPDGGEIHMGLERIRDRAVIWVKDTGIGIGEADLKRIFDRFYQSDPARTHTGEGFGLGLSIAKWIVESHHGDIRVSSTEGEGTTFTVTFPVFPPPPPTDSHKQATRTRLPIMRRNEDGTLMTTKELEIIRRDDQSTPMD